MILKKIRNIVRWVVVLFFSTTILAVVAYRFIPVYVTPLMIIRCFQQVADGESITLHHHWVSMDKISPHMPVAVMASEDARFLKHHGFDFNAIESAAKNNARGGKFCAGYVWTQADWLGVCIVGISFAFISLMISLSNKK